MGTDYLGPTEEELYLDLLEGIDDGAEPSTDDGWYSFAFLYSLTHNLTADQFRDQINKSVDEGKREKIYHKQRVFYRKI